MYGIGRAEAARFERDSRCFERHSKVLRATQQKGWAPFRSLMPLTPYFRPRGSGGGPDLRITRMNYFVDVGPGIPISAILDYNLYLGLSVSLL